MTINKSIRIQLITPLRNNADQPPYILLGIFVQVAAIERDLSLRIIPKTQDEINQRGIPCPTRSDDGQLFTRG